MTAAIAAMTFGSAEKTAVAGQRLDMTAAERLEYHTEGLARAFEELFPAADVQVMGNVLNGGHEYYAEKFADGTIKSGTVAVVQVYARPHRSVPRGG